jgi:hypothetical protein
MRLGRDREFTATSAWKARQAAAPEAPACNGYDRSERGGLKTAMSAEREVS